MGKDLAVGDFNGDGKQDLAVINESMTYVYRGPFTRSGTTGTVTKLDKATSFYATALISGQSQRRQQDRHRAHRRRGHQ